MASLFGVVRQWPFLDESFQGCRDLFYLPNQESSEVDVFSSYNLFPGCAPFLPAEPCRSCPDIGFMAATDNLHNGHCVTLKKAWHLQIGIAMGFTHELVTD